MPRYFFDLIDGRQDRDETGVEFSDPMTARYEAIRYAGEVMRHEPRRLDQGEMRVDVTRDDGLVLFSIEVRLRRPELAHRA